MDTFIESQNQNDFDIKKTNLPQILKNVKH